MICAKRAAMPLELTSAGTLVGRRVLVTGGSGFIGACLCRQLVALGADVHATSRGPLADGCGVAWQTCDVVDSEAIRALFRRVKPELVFHLASHVVGARTLDAVLPTFHGNLASTVNVLLAAQECGCQRVILTGSSEEPDPGVEWPVPSSPYAAAKFAAGAYGRMFTALFGLSVVTLRVFMVYGPGQRDEAKLVPHVITSLLKGEQPRLGSGVREVDWIYVDDVVDAFVRAAIAPNIAGATVDVGCGELVMVRRVVEQIYEIVSSKQKPIFGLAGDRPMEQVRVANVDASLQTIGWQPRVGLLEGLQRTVNWYRRRREDTREPKQHPF